MAKIIPGILVKTEEDYKQRLKKAEHVCDLIQVDIVDGKFSKNKTIGFDVVSKYQTIASLEIQLMVNKPTKFIKKFRELEYVSRIIFPIESGEDIKQNIYLVKKSGKQVGISLNWDTPVTAAIDYFTDIDVLLLMTGKAGYSGQELGVDTYDKIKQVKTISFEMPIEIDIGVNISNVRKLALTGANFLVASSALYDSSDFRNSFESLEKEARVAHN